MDPVWALKRWAPRRLFRYGLATTIAYLFPYGGILVRNCRFQIRNELHPRPRSEEIGALDTLGCDFQEEIDVSDVGPAEIRTLTSRGSRKSTLA